jgi:large conductance mechanosensitive channel
MSWVDEFKAFIQRGNVLDLAIGVIVGGAFGKITSSLVDDVVMPPLGLLLGRVDFSNLFIDLSGKGYQTLAEAQQHGAAVIKYGQFINTVINFFLVALVVFFLMKQVNRITRKPEPIAPAEPTTKDCPECLAAIPIAAKRCQMCASALNS